MSIWQKDRNGNLVSSPNPLEIALYFAIVASGLCFYMSNYFGLQEIPRIIISVGAGVIVFAFILKVLWPKSIATREESTE